MCTCNPGTVSSSLCAGVENYSPGGVDLLIGDLSPLPHGAHPPGQAETRSKQQLLAQCICACRVSSHLCSYQYCIVLGVVDLVAFLPRYQVVETCMYAIVRFGVYGYCDLLHPITKSVCVSENLMCCDVMLLFVGTSYVKLYSSKCMQACINILDPS